MRIRLLLSRNISRACATACMLALAATCLGPSNLARAGESLAQTIETVQPRMAKIYGAGGVRGLEAYQSGFLISAEGHILTVWSYTLDTDHLGVTLNDGSKYQAQLLGGDPRLEIAVLKIEASDLPYFDLTTSVPAETGSRVLAFSNLFGVATGDEPASVQHGIVAAKTRLDARRGAFESPYRGSIYVLDAMTNNPGAAGGALTNQYGELLALLGKELRSAQNNIWLNYAVPISEIRDSVDQILAGKFQPSENKPELKPQDAIQLAQLGIVLVPDVLERTPAYIDEVRAGSPAAQAGVRADDLVIFVGDRLVHSCKGLRDELARVERDTPLRLALMRGQELVNVEIPPVAAEGGQQP